MTVLVVLAVFYLAWNAHVCAQEPPAGQQVANWPAIEAMLDENCYGCHGDGESEGGLDLQGLSRDLQHNHPAGRTWLRVRRAIELNQMPPDEAWSSTDPARVKLIEQLSQAIQTAAAKQRATNRGASWRVMNRSEYQATMTALLGIEIDYCRDLPPDALAPDGFLKDASHQQITAVHLEQYLAAARRGLKRILLTGPPPEVFE